jgi:hypothetical protein
MGLCWYLMKIGTKDEECMGSFYLAEQDLYIKKRNKTA